MRLGARADILRRQLARHGKPVPDWAIAPSLGAHLLFYWEAFGDLGSCRAVGMGPGRIPWTAVKSYGETYGISDPDELAAFAEIITAMDLAYLECQRAGETGAPPAGDRRPRPGARRRAR